MIDRKNQNTESGVFNPSSPFAPALDYLVDAAQRSVLFWDVMGKRAKQYHEHLAKDAPHVLSYETEIVMDGRKLTAPSTTLWSASFRPKALLSIKTAGRLASLIRAPDTGPASEASRPTARSVSRSRPGTPVISSAFCQNPCRDRRSKILRGRRRSSLKK